ncbi:metacaspase-1 [Plasmodium brasilianum]|uniref:Metacaspase 1, putative n=2 Tax=Plasmodium (Plasmodium) TaxID=418103 RepID=A0A1D3SMJ1_PLAMA|nr:metacaspase 1, putative [Plasmodium malariae]KAI4837175.1 metacaspase-1 [Plasmodium brasilianum]SCO93059.1 metacaspase 1, putative [Plasmodium malariae]
MKSIYLKIFELSELKEEDGSAYYVKIYWRNKKYKTTTLRDGFYLFNKSFLLPVESVGDEKNEILSVEVWSNAIINRKVAYTFFSLEFITKERIIKEKIKLINILKNCTLELSLNIVRSENDIIFFNIKEICYNRTDNEIRQAILTYKNEEDVIMQLQKKKHNFPDNIAINDMSLPLNTYNNFTFQKDIPKIEQNYAFPHSEQRSRFPTHATLLSAPLDTRNTHYICGTDNSCNNSSMILTGSSSAYPTLNRVQDAANSSSIMYNIDRNSNNYAANNNNTMSAHFPRKENDNAQLGNTNSYVSTFHQGYMYNCSPSPYVEQILYFSSGNKKKALLIGINYYGSKDELKGCTNDTVRMKNLLVSKYNFYDSSMNIVRLIDNENDPNYRPTRRNILSAITWLTKENKAGDILFFLYSGHGSQQKDLSYIEEDGYNETILPSDYKTEGHIIDDELHKHLIQPLNNGVKLIAVMDCCNSGSSIDLAYKYKMKSRKWKEVKNPFHVVCDVSQLSGCKDNDFSYEIDNGRNAPGGSMVTAIIHILSPTNIISPSYEHLLNSINSYIKTYRKQTVTFMASQKFNLDRVFDFEHVLKNRNEKLGQIINEHNLKKKKKKKKKKYQDLFELF